MATSKTYKYAPLPKRETGLPIKSFTSLQDAENQIDKLRINIKKLILEYKDIRHDLHKTSRTPALNAFAAIFRTFLIVSSGLMCSVGSELTYDFKDQMFAHLEYDDIKLAKLYHNYSKYFNYSQEHGKKEFLAQPLDFGDLVTRVGQFLLFSHLVYILNLVFSISIPFHKVPFSYAISGILTSLMILLELNVTNVYLNKESSQSVEQSFELQGRISKEYRVNSGDHFSVSVDMVQLWGECCGSIDSHDFNSSILSEDLNRTLFVNKLAVPLTCCDAGTFRDEAEGIIDSNKKPVVFCAEQHVQVNKKGCFESIREFLTGYTLIYVVVLGSLHFMDLCLLTFSYAFYLALYRDEHEVYKEMSAKTWLLRDLEEDLLEQWERKLKKEKERQCR